MDPRWQDCTAECGSFSLLFLRLPKLSGASCLRMAFVLRVYGSEAP